VDGDLSGGEALTDLTQRFGKALGQDHMASAAAPVVWGISGSMINGHLLPSFALKPTSY
jgi:hypothetical protein